MRLNKVAGIAASTFFTGALVLGMAATASATPDLGSLGSQAPSCGVQVTSGNLQGWTGLDAVQEPAFTDAGLEYNDSANKHVEFYKPAASALSDVSGGDFSYTFKVEEGANVPALQVRVVGATTSKWPTPGGTGFATLVWSPTAEQIAAADGGWVTIAGAELESSANWWLTGTDTTKRTFAQIALANPDAQVEHVGMTMTPGTPASTTVVSQFTYKECVNTFSAPTDTGSLSSLAGIGNLGGLLANLAG